MKMMKKFAFVLALAALLATSATAWAAIGGGDEIVQPGPITVVMDGVNEKAQEW